MSKVQMSDFATTGEKGLPMHKESDKDRGWAKLAKKAKAK
jgi:hypothetical protein